MAHCVNTSSKEFKELSRQTNLTVPVLKAKVGIWQSKNGYESYPSKEDIFATMPLANRVGIYKNTLSYAQTIGIKERVAYYNKHNPKIFVQFQQIGQADMYSWKIQELQPEANQQSLFQLPSSEGQIVSEKTIRELAARMSNRIGMPIKFDTDRTKEYKGKIENGIAYINLVYATLDTPIHEILGHPIIRAIKGNDTYTINKKPIILETGKIPLDGRDGYKYEVFINSKNGKEFKTEEEAKSYIESQKNQLYQNLLKELETGKGKEVLDRIKRDYKKEAYDYMDYVTILDEETFNNQYKEYYKNYKDYVDTWTERNKEQQEKADKYNSNDANFQEEAIVELLGLMTAEKLDNVKDGKLISLLKRLLKEMKQFIRSLINQKEVEIDKLPDNMTINDLADLLAYSNSKLILPGYEVEYTTPDNMKFKTYTEASNHISNLFKSFQDVNLNNIEINKQDLLKPKREDFNVPEGVIFRNKEVIDIIYNPGTALKYFIDENEYDPGEPDLFTLLYKDETAELFEDSGSLGSEVPFIYNYGEYAYNVALDEYKRDLHKGVKSFIEKNKEFEQSKEIIEEWKKVNNIQYNPEEIYSRGQEFVSVVAAYSSFDINLMMQNLLSHIEDNEKAGGKFAISAFTKPIGKTIAHLEGDGGKIKFKIYPQSEDILWAANTDVFSGSVWDASEKVNKDKKSELVGVSYTKYPALANVNTVQPNLAFIIDYLAHAHNELGIVLNGNNFRLEYDEDITYQTKKIVDNINSILDQKYGKIVKPDIEKLISKLVSTYKITAETPYGDYYTVPNVSFSDKQSAEKWIKEQYEKGNDEVGYTIKQIIKGIAPKITDKNLKESINSIKTNLDILENDDLIGNKEYIAEEEHYIQEMKLHLIPKIQPNGKWKIIFETSSFIPKEEYDTKAEALEEIKSKIEKREKDLYRIKNGKNDKPYTSQALINTKIAVLKEVAKKYPRSLIRSEVKKGYDMFGDDLPFQKIPSKSKKQKIATFKEITASNFEKIGGVLSNSFDIKELGGKLYYTLNKEEQTVWERYVKASNSKSNPSKTINGFVLQYKPNLSILREDKETGELYYWIDFGEDLYRVKIDLLVTNADNAELKSLKAKQKVIDSIANKKQELKRERLLLAERRISEKVIGTFVVRDALHNLQQVYTQLTASTLDRNIGLELTEEQSQEIKEVFKAFEKKITDLNLNEDLSNSDKKSLINNLIGKVEKTATSDEELFSILSILEKLPNNLLGRLIIISDKNGFMRIEEDPIQNPINRKANHLKTVYQNSLFNKNGFYSKIGGFYKFIEKHKNLYITKDDIKNLNKYILESNFEEIPINLRKKTTQYTYIVDLITDKALKQGLSEIEIVDLLQDYKNEIQKFALESKEFAKDRYPNLFETIESSFGTIVSLKNIMTSNVLIAFAHPRYAGVHDHVFSHELGHTIDAFLFQNKPEMREDLYKFTEELLSLISDKSKGSQLVFEYLANGLLQRNYDAKHYHEVVPDILGTLSIMLTEKSAERLSVNSFMKPMFDLLNSNDSDINALFDKHLSKYIKNTEKVVSEEKLTLLEKLKNFFKELIQDIKNYIGLGKDITSEEVTLLDNFLNLMENTILGEEENFLEFPTKNVSNRQNPQTGEEYSMWLENPNNDNQVENQQEINYSLKAVEMLNSKKAEELFAKGQKNKWSLDKTLTELQVPKEQKQLILDISNNIYNVWHSSNDKIDSFIKENINGYFATVKKGSPKAVFFTANKPPQESFLSQREYQKQFSVKMDKPLIVDTKTGYSRETEGFKALVNRALDNGYDGVIVKNVDDNGFNGDVYISLNSDNISTDLREQLALELASKYSYTVEINTAKEKLTGKIAAEEGMYVKEENGKYYLVDAAYSTKNEISKQEYEDFNNNKQIPTKHYSNLTVPGGTNYTENEIKTPAIEPIIKGHAQFRTDNGIGWFRSDDKTPIIEGYEKNQESPEEWGVEDAVFKQEPKTRRILEVQSDLFQKWRNKFEFENNKYTAEKDTESVWHYYKNGSEINSNEYTKIWNIFLETYLDNADAFTKLLQKDNNWVTFFVKSIIQDSAKKGYEKVLFPSGNTASKVEGHTTLEEFKKQKENRISKLNKNLDELNDLKVVPEKRDFFGKLQDIFIIKDSEEFTPEAKYKTLNRPFISKEEAQNEIDNEIEKVVTEINQLKQELERVETEGFGALKPIVGNIPLDIKSNGAVKS